MVNRARQVSRRKGNKKNQNRHDARLATEITAHQRASMRNATKAVSEHGDSDIRLPSFPHGVKRCG